MTKTTTKLAVDTIVDASAPAAPAAIERQLTGIFRTVVLMCSLRGGRGNYAEASSAASAARCSVIIAARLAAFSACFSFSIMRAAASSMSRLWRASSRAIASAVVAAARSRKASSGLPKTSTLEIVPAFGKTWIGVLMSGVYPFRTWNASSCRAVVVGPITVRQYGFEALH
jgi:hypothetical protein